MLPLAFKALLNLVLLPYIVIFSELPVEEIRILIVLFLYFPTNPLIFTFCLQFEISLVHADVRRCELHKNLNGYVQLSFCERGCVYSHRVWGVIENFNESIILC